MLLLKAIYETLSQLDFAHPGCNKTLRYPNALLTDGVDVIPAKAGMTGLAKLLMVGIQEQLSHF